MWRSRRRWSTLLGVGVTGTALLTLSLGTGSAQPVGQDRAGRAGTAAATGQQADRPGAQRTVTLVTGDRVIVEKVGGRDRLRVVPAEGRERIGFNLTRAGGRHQYVVPSDAGRLIAKGRLDRRLFDVRELLRSGYDDRASTTLPLIVTYDRKARSRPNPDALPGVEQTRDLPAVGAKAATVEKGRAGEAWDRLRRLPGRIWLDGVRRPVLDESVPQIGAPSVWKAGFDGTGVRVAVIDTGIDGSHADLAGRVAAARDFTGTGPRDVIGHGTHVASTIAGRNTTYRGVAPGAELVDAKVCEERGCSESAILAGMTWAVEQQQARVVNISLGGEDTPEVDPVEQAVNDLTAQTGALFVVSAGNSGPGPGTVESPGSADGALTVGAVDKSDSLARFSSRGPRVGDGATKPDLTAPGVGIVAARADGTELGPPVGEHHVRLSGTSMAAPHVAGSAALLAQKRPEWKAPELRSALMGTAAPNASLGSYEQGAGRVDIARGIDATILAEPASLSFDPQRWPHDDDTPQTKSLTYRNVGDRPVTLRLEAAMTGPDGEPAPDSAVRLDRTTLEVPAGGTASVDVTSNTAHDGPDGSYSGRVVATAGPDGSGGTVGTPIAVQKEIESYELTVEHLNRDGEPEGFYELSVLGEGNGVDQFGEGEADEPYRVTLPKGRYHLNSFLQFGPEDEPSTAFTTQPALDLDKDTKVVVDARKAKPIGIGVEGTDVVEPLEVGYLRTGAGEPNVWYSFSTVIPWWGGPDHVFTAHLGPTASKQKMTSWVGAQGQDKAARSIYTLADHRLGRFYTGFDRTYALNDLARVRERHLAQGDAPLVLRQLFAQLPNGAGTEVTNLFMFEHPTTVTSYRTPGRWYESFAQGRPSDDPWEPIDSDTYLEARTSYPKAKRYRHDWNGAVLNPTMLPSPQEPVAPLARNGDVVQIASWPLSDGAGDAGWSRTTRERTTLYRGEEKIGESGDAGFGRFAVPAEESEYRMEVSTQRAAGLPYSTRVDTAWTFRSRHVPEGPDDIESWRPLPAWAPKFAPRVDERNRVARTPFHVLPIRAESVAGSSVGRLGTPRLELSYDSGRTWHRAPVAGALGHWFALVEPPDDARHVSLRVRAADSKGNRVAQTVIRAYGIA